MVDDSERREVERRLREEADYPGHAVQYMEQFISDLRQVLFGDLNPTADYSEMFARLADLIEPSYEPTGECVNPLGEFFGEDCPYFEDEDMECFENEGSYYKDGVRVIDCGPCRHYHSQDTTTDTTKSPELATKCDRDALLRLARYMDKDVAETEAHFSNVISTKSVSDYARRIREAVGVER